MDLPTDENGKPYIGIDKRDISKGEPYVIRIIDGHWHSDAVDFSPLNIGLALESTPYKEEDLNRFYREWMSKTTPR